MAESERPQQDLERELAESRALTTAIFGASYDGIAVLDADGVFLDVNAAFERLTGIPRDRWVSPRTPRQFHRIP